MSDVMRVRVVIPYDGAYLLEELCNPNYPERRGKVRLIGGGVDAHESPVAAAVRELREELGYVLLAHDLQSLGLAVHPQWGHLEEIFLLPKHTLVPGAYKCDANSGDPTVKLVRGTFDQPNFFGVDPSALL